MKRVIRVKYDTISVVYTVFVILVYAICISTFRKYDLSTALFCVLVGFVGAWIVGSVCMMPVKIYVGEEGLHIKRVVGSKIIQWCDINRIERRDLTPGDIRICANGGFFGHVGWWYNRETGKYFSYISDRANTVMISLSSGRRYMISCMNPDELIEVARNRMG